MYGKEKLTMKLDEQFRKWARILKSEERLVELPAGYAMILAALRDQIRSARLKAKLAVNRELVTSILENRKSDSKAAA
jgi:hypothetical protein